MNDTIDNNKKGSSMDDVVFDERNKLYGAYQLRKNFVKNFLLAMLFSATALTLSIFLYSFALKNKEKVEEEVVMQDVVLEDVALDTKEPEPPKVEPPPPAVEQIQFLPPEIRETVVEEVIPPNIDSLDKVKNIGQETQKGDTSLMTIGENTEAKKIVEDDQDDIPHATVEENAEFPGGKAAMTKFVNKNLIYPETARRKDITGTVVVYFEIDKAGKIVNARVLKGFNKECEDEALRVVRSFPDWKPAKMNGRVVRQRTSLPLRFALPED